jgi:cell division protein FtsW
MTNVAAPLYQNSNLTLGQRIDWPLLCLWFALLSIGLVMVASASISFAAASKFTHNEAWYFARRHGIYLL